MLFEREDLYFEGKWKTSFVRRRCSSDEMSTCSLNEREKVRFEGRKEVRLSRESATCTATHA